VVVIRAGSGIGTGDAAAAGRAAADEAAHGLERASFAFAFTSGLDDEDAGTALEAIRDRLGGVPVIGCSGGGVVGTGREVEGEPAIAVLAVAADPDQLACEPFLAPLTGSGAPDADALAARIAGKGRGADRSTLVLCADPFRFDAKPFLARLATKVPKLPVVGGLASSDERERAPVFAGGAPTGHAVAGALLSGPRLRATVAVAQGCRPVAAAGKVTRAEKNVLFELDGEPAIHRLKTAVEAAQQSGGALFCGLGVEAFRTPTASEDYLARNIIGVDPKTGAVAVAEVVPPGATVCFLVRDAQAAREDLAQRVSELKGAFARKPPAFGLYFDCLGRGAGLYGEPGVDASIIREQLGDVPLAGFFGNGELAPFLGTNLLHNYTGVLLLVGEG
jgi:small ligand-binding sensory domain FIST